MKPSNLCISNLLQVALQTAQLAERDADPREALPELGVHLALEVGRASVADDGRLKGSHDAAAEAIKRSHTNTRVVRVRGLESGMVECVCCVL